MKASRRRSSTGQVWMVAGGATVAFGLLIGASLWSASAREQAKPIDVPVAQTDAELEATGMTMGKAETKAHLVEYGDFL